MPATNQPAAPATDLDALLASIPDDGQPSAPAAQAPQAPAAPSQSGIPPLVAPEQSQPIVPPLTAPQDPTAAPTEADLAEQDAQAQALGTKVLTEPTYQLPMIGGGTDPTLADKALRLGAAAGGGIVMGGINTKDAIVHAYQFFTGGEPSGPEDHSQFRRDLERQQAGLMQDRGWAGQLAAGLGELVPGLLVAGGAGAALSRVPMLARFGGMLGSTARGAIKVAAASGLSLDPHAGNIANMVDTYAPVLSNPVTEALAAHPDRDSEATGRLKNAIGSIGFDLALAGVLTGSVALSRAVRTGDTAAAQAATKEIVDAQEAHASTASPTREPDPRLDSKGTNDNAPSGTDLPGANDNSNAPILSPLREGTAQPTTISGYGQRTEAAMRAAQDAASAPPGRRTPADFLRESNAQAEADIGAGKPGVHVLQGVEEPKGNPGTFDQGQPYDTAGHIAAGKPESVISNATEVAMRRAQLEADAQAPVDAARQAVIDAGTAKVEVAMRPEMSLGDSARAFLDTGVGQARSTVTYGDRSRVEFGTEVDASSPDRLAQGPRAPLARSEPLPGDAPAAGPNVPAPSPSGGPTGRASGSARTPAFVLPDVTPESAAAIAASAREDLTVLAAHNGDWTSAIQDHQFGQGAGIPWQKLSQPDDVNVFMTRMVDALKPQFDTLKGGDVLSDARVNEMLAQRAKLYNIDPSAMLGRLVAAGDRAGEMAANMEASTLIASRVNHDIAALSARIDAGDLAAYGGDLQAAHADLARRIAVFQAAYGAAQSLKSNAARTLRRMRTEFQVDPEVLNSLRDVDPAVLAKTVSSLKGDPAKLAKLTPSLIRRLTDDFGFLVVSNLLSRPETHYVGLMTNTAQMLLRPAERIVGSFGVGNAGASIREQAFRQYYYMGASVMDGFRAAANAFLEGDSRIAPHSNEVRNLTAAEASGPVTLPFKAGDGASDNIFNTLMAAIGPKVWQAISIGPRLLGTVDEMHKMITYRSMVMAKAHMEGAAQLRAAGITGPEAQQALGDFIKQRLAAAFDDAGYATDRAAQQEAEVATYSQKLNQGTLGSGIQQLVGSVPALRFIVPFVKGPTNVLRYGWKMTPGLNLLQSEFRDAYFGRMGVEAQTQAIGQMGLAQGLLGSAAFMASEGLITGGGPNNPEARAQLRATGWQPYSFVIRAEGTTHYVNFGKYDPLALPFGVVADLYQASQHPDADGGIGSAVAAITMAVAKSVANKSYLSSAVNAMDTFTSDNQRKWDRFIGTELANLIPFSAGQRFVTNTVTDGYLRDARTWTDQVIAQTPGLSDKLPPVRNWLGEPVHQSPMLYSAREDNLVDQEVQRLILETGKDGSIGVVSRPSPTIGHNTDLRTITLKDGSDAYDKYQQLAAQPSPKSPTLRSVMNKIMASKAYEDAPDGPANVAGTKLHMLEGPKRDYHSAALKIISADPNVSAALHQDEFSVASAYATKKRDPAGVGSQAKALDALMRSSGMSVPGLTANVPK